MVASRILSIVARRRTDVLIAPRGRASPGAPSADDANGLVRSDDPIREEISPVPPASTQSRPRAVAPAKGDGNVRIEESRSDLGGGGGGAGAGDGRGARPVPRRVPAGSLRLAGHGGAGPGAVRVAARHGRPVLDLPGLELGGRLADGAA